MKVVLDTSVLISALLFGGLPERVVLARLAGRGTIVSSPFIKCQKTAGFSPLLNGSLEQTQGIVSA